MTEPVLVEQTPEDSPIDTQKAQTTQQLLLDRLLTTPQVPTQAPRATLLIILFAIIAGGFGVYLVTKQPDKFAVDQEQAQSDPHASITGDTTELHQKRILLRPIIDSLKLVVAHNPADTAALLDLGNVYFDVENWPEAMRMYEAYLKANPKNADIRVEYAAAIVRAQHDPEAALNQIEKALEDDPNNLRGLFTAGMIASMKIGNSADHTEAIAQAKDYFRRARKAAEQRDTSVIPAIDEMLSKFEAIKTPPTAQ